MKKIKINKIYIVVPVIVFLSLSLLILGFYSSATKKNITDMNTNFYRFVPGDGTLEDEEIISNDSLSSIHCLNDICIENVVVHKSPSLGRVDFTLKNNSSDVVSGFLKLVFSEGSVIVNYSSVAPNSSIDSFAEFAKFDIKDSSDYTLENLSDDELKSIVVH